jgi:DTW domain-containing protein YfiP
MRCRRAMRVCYCAHLPRIETRTRIVILQHPRERDMPIGTAHMASLCLPRAELHVGTCVADSPALARALDDPARPAVLLYPGEDAIDIVEHPPLEPVTLVVIDGTWSQAKKIVKHDPHLSRLPRYAFTPATPSEYRIRREPAAEYVSTIEALMHVLGALEGDAARFRALLLPFRAMVDAQIAHAASGASTRIKKPRRERPVKPRVPPMLRARSSDLVCVVGEVNAWPYSAPERARFPEELVHWVAVRLATGEMFECVLAPKHPLAPGTLRWVELPKERIEGGAHISELADRWSAFSRSEDVVVSWGSYATNVFNAAGQALAEARIDLREAARMWARGNVGTLEDFLRTINATTLVPITDGRAGRRLGQVASIARFLASS